MSLNWSSHKCNPPLPANDDENAFRTSLVFLSLGLDLGSVTEDNVDEWLWRIWHQHTAGLEYMEIPDSMTPQEVRARIARWVGLSMNVASKPRKEYLKRVLEVLVIRTNLDLDYRSETADKTSDNSDEGQPA